MHCSCELHINSIRLYIHVFIYLFIFAFLFIASVSQVSVIGHLGFLILMLLDKQNMCSPADLLLEADILPPEF